MKTESNQTLVKVPCKAYAGLMMMGKKFTFLSARDYPAELFCSKRAFTL